MHRPSQSNLSHVFVILCFSLNVFAITTQQIGLQLNTGLADKSKYVYNAIVQFQDDVLATWSNEQIVGVAEQAYNDMRVAQSADARRYPGLKLPGVISVIAQGHTLYISSSLTGGGSLIYVPNTTNARFKFAPGIISQANDLGIIEWALMNCEVRSTNAAGHRAGGNCGEPMAGLAWATMNPTGVLDGAKVVTWGKFKSNGAWTTGVMDPCQKGAGLQYTDVWGCHALTGPNGLNMIVIDAGTQPQDTPLNYNPTVTYPCFN